jgi:hypothetical protein
VTGTLGFISSLIGGTMTTSFSVLSSLSVFRWLCFLGASCVVAFTCIDGFLGVDSLTGSSITTGFTFSINFAGSIDLFGSVDGSDMAGSLFISTVGSFGSLISTVSSFTLFAVTDTFSGLEGSIVSGALENSPTKKMISQMNILVIAIFSERIVKLTTLLSVVRYRYDSP